MAQRGTGATIGIGATIAAFALAGCASTPVLPTAVATTSPTLAVAIPTPTPSLPTPAGFQPVALSAISENDFWVLGRAPCTTVNGCASEILRTTNGGASFQRIPAPVTVYLTGSGTGGSPTVSDLRFADASDGWAFGDGPAYVTHDGGAHWYELNPEWTFLQIEPGANGYVYASVEICPTPSSTTGCVDALMRSQAGGDAWVKLAIPGTPVGWPSIGVHGNTVWVMYFDSSIRVAWTSGDDGQVWNPASMPCEPDLGGLFDPVSTSVIWAFCATGTEGDAAVSTNGGAFYVTHDGPATAFGNGSFVGALSAREAFVAGPAGVAVTTNGGLSYHTLPQPPGARWIGFTDSEVGYVISQNQTTLASQLWRTTDGGSVWAVVSLT
jgi:photosystem II stability/assembly factor-like uncharacterized protein